MRLQDIQAVLEAEVIVGKARIGDSVEHVYASDLMSDVLAFGQSDSVLLTGLASQQAVISAHMAEFKAVVFVRGKTPRDGASARFAEDHNLVLLATKLDMYDACVRIGSPNGAVTPGEKVATPSSGSDNILLRKEFFIKENDLAEAGMVSTQIKSVLKKIGFKSDIVRRVAISTYEGEMNVAMHATEAKVVLTVTPKLVTVVIDDTGPGIPDIELAMQEGFTTATEEMRAMGFGSGMGLPNIKRNTDELNIKRKEEAGKRGVRLEMKFFA